MQHEVLWGHVCAALIDGNTHGCDLGATGLSIGHVFVPKKDLPAKWVWVNTYRYIFSGMNIHLPGFWPIPKCVWHVKKNQSSWYIKTDIDLIGFIDDSNFHVTLRVLARQGEGTTSDQPPGAL